MIRVFLVILFLLPGLQQTWAQIRIDTLRGIIRAIYLPDRDSVLRTYLDGYGLSSPDDPLKERRFRIRGWSEVHAFSYFYVNQRNELLMIDWVDASISKVIGNRIDSSGSAGYPKMFIETTTFQDQSDIYLYGGYGFWSARNRLVRINDEYRWEPVMLNSSGGGSTARQHPPGIFENQAVVVNGQVYLFNGRYVNPEEPLEKPHFKEVWSFDLKKKIWRLRGRTNPKLFPEPPRGRTLIGMKDRAFIFRDEKNVIELFPEKNYATVYNHTLISSEILKSEMWSLTPFYRKGKIYFYRNLNPTITKPLDQMNFELKMIPIEKFLGDQVGEEYFFEEDWKLLRDWRSWSVMLLFVGYLTYRLSRGKPTRSRLELTASGLRYRSKDYEVQPVHLSVLRKLYDASGPVSSNEILQLVQNPSLKYSHNNRVKNEVIRELNIQLQSILNTSDELITMRTSDDDKRYKWYELRRDLI